ncbi:zinc finger protein 91-like [Drosophila novamexicana]|uniref:zinc finger protein 91-like n=1 Tax=Drosophila novamexicana TaxID=47314 RepID=UPI0011E5E26A|nr:zinc finger protein 91-like [Drosophila novamexicana]
MESAIKMEMPEEEIDIVRLGMDIEELLSPGNELPEDQMEYMSEDECKANTPIGNFSSRDVNQRQSSLLLDNTNLSNSELSVRSELLEIENWELAEQDKDIGCSKEVKDSLKNIEEEQTELSLHSYKECTIAANEPKIDANKTKFMCPQCPKAYKNKSTLKSHIRTHTCERPFQCPHCPKAFKQSMHLRNHISNHEGKAAFKCPHCRKYFIEKAKYDEHTRFHIGHRAYKCLHCPKIYTTISMLKEHILTHNANNSDVNVQSERVEIENSELAGQDNEIGCTEEVKNSLKTMNEKQAEPSLKRYEECTVKHQEVFNPLAVDEPRIDAKKKQFICPQCPKVYKNISSFNVHIRMHSSERPFQCPHCPKSFKIFGILRSHISTHKGKTVFKCPHCRKFFSEKAKFDEHTRFHIGHRAYKCLHCPKIYTHITFFKEHILTHSANNSDVNVQSELLEIENSKLAEQDNEIGCSKDVKDTEVTIKEEQTELSSNSYEECTVERYEIGNPLAVDEPRIDAEKEQFICPQCQKAYKNTSSLNVHIRKHSSERPFQCPHCPKSFKVSENLRSHISTHKGKTVFKCPHCTKFFLEKAQYDEHTRYHIGHRVYKCLHCPKIYTHITFFKEHILTHSTNNSEVNVQSDRVEIENNELAGQDNEIGCSNEDNEIGCTEEVKNSLKSIKEEQTELSSNSYEECTVEHHEVCNPLAVNEPRIDDKKKQFICPQCPKVYKNISSLNVHIRMHSGERPFQCPHCPKSFKIFAILRSHISTHKGKTVFKCPHCRKFFLEKAEYDEHTRFHIGHRAYKCLHCPKILVNISSFKAHISIHPTNNSEVNVQSERVEIENSELAGQDNEIGCSNEVKDKEDIIEEEQTEISLENYEGCTAERYEISNPLAVEEPRIDAKKKQFICPQCQKAFKTKFMLTSHLSTTHSDERPFQCPHCPKAFKRFGILRSHVYTHNRTTAFKCPHCRRYFLEKAKYDEHTSFHVGHRLYKCPQCSKICTHYTRFKNHIRIHHANNSEGQTELSFKSYDECTTAVNEPTIDAKKTKFICPQCPKAYKYKTSLKSHMRTHTCERPFQCPHCPKAFKQFMHLRNHIYKHKGKTTFKCPHCRKYFIEKAKYDEHTRCHIGHRLYKCPHCSKICSDQTRFKKHILIHHANNSEINVQSELLEIENWELAEQENQIDFSKEVKDSEVNIKEEQTELSSNSYEECTVERYEIGNPLAVDEPRIDAKKKQFICPQCQKACKNTSSLNVHIRLHSSERPFPCPHCPKTFKTFWILRCHISTHKGKTALKCPHCRRYFLEKAKYDEHTRFHIGHRAYKCLHCPKIFTTISFFKAHILIHPTNNSEVDVQSERVEIENSELAGQDNEIGCSNEVKDKEDIIEEEQTEISLQNYEECHERHEICDPLAVDEPRIDAKKKQYLCPQCQKAFKTKFMLTSHLRTHSNE